MSSTAEVFAAPPTIPLAAREALVFRPGERAALLWERLPLSYGGWVVVHASCVLSQGCHRGGPVNVRCCLLHGSDF